MGLELATVGSCQKRDETPMNTGERDASTHASLDPKELFPWRKGYLSKGTFLDLTFGSTIEGLPQPALVTTKQPYQSPGIAVYGTVVELTRGSGGAYDDEC